MRIQSIFLFLISFFCINMINAQLNGFGISAGGNASTFEYGDQIQTINEFDNSNTVGGTGGIQFDFNLGSEMVKLSPEIFIIQNGSKEYYTLDNITTELISRNVNLDYVGLYLPLQFYVPIDDGTNNTAYQYNGLTFNVSAFVDYAIGGEVSPEMGITESITFQKDVDKLDFGVSAMAGFIANGFSLTFGYNYGLKNIEFNESLGIQNNDDNYLINNRGFTLAVGYKQKL